MAELVPTTTGTGTPVTIPDAGELERAQAIAHAIAQSELVPASYRGKPDAILAAILTARELGIGPMQALRQLHVIDGRVGMSAELMGALVRRAGHRIRVVEATAERATVEGRRRDDPDAPLVITWTVEDARQAGLTSRQGWRQYPRAMLLARAVSMLCRALFPDVLAGCAYTPEEIETSGGDDPDVLDPRPVPTPAPPDGTREPDRDERAAHALTRVATRQQANTWVLQQPEGYRQVLGRLAADRDLDLKHLPMSQVRELLAEAWDVWQGEQATVGEGGEVGA